MPVCLLMSVEAEKSEGVTTPEEMKFEVDQAAVPVELPDILQVDLP